MSTDSQKPLKLCFKNEVHRISRRPADYDALIKNIKSAFKSILPSSWTLKYEDSDGDLVMLGNDNDYQSMLESELESESKSIKIFIHPQEERVLAEEPIININNHEVSSKFKALDNFTIQENQQEPEIFKEKVIEEKKIIPKISREIVPEVKEREQEEVKFVEKKPEEKEPEWPIKPEGRINKEIDNIITEVVEKDKRLEGDWRCHKAGEECCLSLECNKERLRQMMTEVMMENIQRIAGLVKEEIMREMKEMKAEEKKEEMKAEEKKEKKPLFEIELTKEASTIPSKITLSDKVIYKTIVVKNSGATQWPKDAFLVNVEGLKGPETRLSPVDPGKETSCVLIMNNPGRGGQFSSTWSLSYKDEKGNTQHTGEPFTVGFKVEGPEEYPKEVQELARQLIDIFPGDSIEKLSEFVAKHPKSTLEQLIELKFSEQ